MRALNTETHTGVGEGIPEGKDASVLSSGTTILVKIQKTGIPGRELKHRGKESKEHSWLHFLCNQDIQESIWSQLAGHQTSFQKTWFYNQVSCALFLRKNLHRVLHESLVWELSLPISSSHDAKIQHFTFFSPARTVRNPKRASQNVGRQWPAGWTSLWLIRTNLHLNPVWFSELPSDIWLWSGPLPSRVNT